MGCQSDAEGWRIPGERLVPESGKSSVYTGKPKELDSRMVAAEAVTDRLYPQARLEGRQAKLYRFSHRVSCLSSLQVLLIWTTSLSESFLDIPHRPTL